MGGASTHTHTAVQQSGGEVVHACYCCVCPPMLPPSKPLTLTQPETVPLPPQVTQQELQAKREAAAAADQSARDAQARALFYSVLTASAAQSYQLQLPLTAWARALCSFVLPCRNRVETMCCTIMSCSCH